MSVSEVETGTDTRADIINALANANRHAKRQQYVIEKFYGDQPTKWTTAHRYLNDLLTQWEAAK